MIGKLVRSPRDDVAIGALARKPTARKLLVDYATHVVRECGGSVTKAARVLGIGRATLYRLIPSLDVETSGRRAEREKTAAAEYARKHGPWPTM